MDNKDQEEQLLSTISRWRSLAIAFITVKEVADIELLYKLYQEGKITVPGVPFKVL